MEGYRLSAGCGGWVCGCHTQAGLGVACGLDDVELAGLEVVDWVWLSFSLLEAGQLCLGGFGATPQGVLAARGWCSRCPVWQVQWLGVVRIVATLLVLWPVCSHCFAIRFHPPMDMDQGPGWLGGPAVQESWQGCFGGGWVAGCTGEGLQGGQGMLEPLPWDGRCRRRKRATVARRLDGLSNCVPWQGEGCELLGAGVGRTANCSSLLVWWLVALAEPRRSCHPRPWVAGASCAKLVPGSRLHTHPRSDRGRALWCGPAQRGQTHSDCPDAVWHFSPRSVLLRVAWADRGWQHKGRRSAGGRRLGLGSRCGIRFGSLRPGLFPKVGGRKGTLARHSAVWAGKQWVCEILWTKYRQADGAGGWENAW